MLDEAIKKLASGKNIAAVTTLLPDGALRADAWLAGSY
jgi:hypothetical protein